jgi:hypothetical protein
LGFALCAFLVGGCLALRASSEWDYNIMYYRTHLRMGSFFIGVTFHYLRKHSVFSKDSAKYLKAQIMMLIPLYFYYL